MADADFEYVSQAEATEVVRGPKPPKDFSYHFSRVTAARKESSVKDFYKYFLIPGIVQLAGGEFFGPFCYALNFYRSSARRCCACHRTTILRTTRRSSKCRILPI